MEDRAEIIKQFLTIKHYLPFGFGDEVCRRLDIEQPHKVYKVVSGKCFNIEIISILIDLCIEEKERINTLHTKLKKFNGNG